MPDDFTTPPVRRRFGRRTLFRLAGVGALAAVGVQAVRIFASSNAHTVIPGRVYRTAQLSGPELSAFIADKGVRTVVNLRGVGPETAWYMAEARATHAANVCQEDVTLSAKRLPPPYEVRRLIEVIDHTAYPIVFHCKQGADRTGLASTVALLLQPGVSLAEARRQLWPIYGHIAAGRTTAMDEFFDFYEEWLADAGRDHTPERFRQWVETAYVPGPFKADLALVGPNPPAPVKVGEGFALTVRATNRSIRPWEFKPGPAGGIRLRCEIYAAGKAIHRGHAGLFARVVPPGESIDLVAAFPPVMVPGWYPVHIDLIDAAAIEMLDSGFVQYGSEPLVTGVAVK